MLSINAKHAPSQGLPTLPHPAPAHSAPAHPCPLCPFTVPAHSASPVPTHSTPARGSSLLQSGTFSPTSRYSFDKWPLLFSCASHSRLFKVPSSLPFPLYLNLLHVPPSFLFQPHLDFPTVCLSVLHLLWPTSRLKVCSLPEQRGTEGSHCEKKACLHFSHTSFGVTVIDPSVDSPGPSVHQSGCLS